MADRPWQVEYRQQIAVQSSSIWECELENKIPFEGSFVNHRVTGYEIL